MDNLTPITREEILMNDEPLTPITREEKILAGEDLNPVTRREYFLKKYRHAGGDVMVEGLSVTANGTYTAPEGKAYSPVEVAVPLPDNAYLLKTASGSLVSFSDGADLPIPSFVCDIDAVQDLHGQDAPWVGGSNINLFDIKAKLTDNARTYTMGGITYTRIDDSDGNALSVKGTGTATEYSFCDIPVTLPAGRYKTNVSGSDANKMGLNLRNSNRSYFKEGNEEFTLTEQTSMYIRYLVASGNIADNTITCMLYKYDGTDKDFVPYSNICPISGHTGVDAWVKGKNLLDISNAVNATNVVASVEADGTIQFKNVTARWSNTHVGKIYVVKGQTYVISASNIQYGRFGFSTSPIQYPTDSTFPNIIVQGGVSPSSIIGWTHTTRYFVANFTGYIYLFYCSDANYDNYHAPFATQIQIEIGDTATTYEPYNSNSQTIQVSWQTEAGEVFGGYVDLVSGELTVTHKSQTGFTRGSQDSSNKLYNIGTIANIKTFIDTRNISPYFINSMFEKMSLWGARTAEIPSIAQHDATLYVGGYIGKEAELDTLLETLQVKYELATPITYQLTPTQIKSLLGENNAWCDTGKIDIDYFTKEVTG